MQNNGFMFFALLTKLLYKGYLLIDPENPRVFKLNAIGTSMFIAGRDDDNEPFIAIPSKFMPFFTEMDWSSASICRKEGYIFLEIYDDETQDMLIALGFKVRRLRLNIFCIKDYENVEDMTLNIKVFHQDEENVENITISSQHEINNISIREIDSSLELGSEDSIEHAKELYDQSGVEKVFKQFKLNT